MKSARERIEPKGEYADYLGSVVAKHGFYVVAGEGAKRGNKALEPYKPNDVDALGKFRNAEIFNGPAMRRAIDLVQSFFMQRLTGEKTISPADRAALNKIEAKIISMLGLPAHPWAMAYMSVVLFGSHDRRFGEYKCGVHYKGVDKQFLSFIGAEKQVLALRVPKTIRLYFTGGGRKSAKLMKSGGKPIEFDVSRDFSHAIIDPFFQSPQQKPISVAPVPDTKMPERFKKNASETFPLKFGS